MTKIVKRPRVIDPGYRAPSEQPEDDLCIRCYVPADQLYIAAFFSQYERLTQWLAWERGGTKAKEAADRWKESFTKSRAEWECAKGECGLLDVRQSEEVPCTLEKLGDCSGEWESFANLSLCAPSMRIRGGTVEQLVGDDWIPVTPAGDEYDERSDAPQVEVWNEETLPPGEDGACLSASNAIAWLLINKWKFCDAMVNGSTVVVVVTLVIGLVSLITGVGVVIAAISTAIIAILLGFGGGVDDWEDARDYDFSSDLLCVLWNAYSDDGTMQKQAWESLLYDLDRIADDMTDEYKSVSINIARLLCWCIGCVGMNRLSNVSGVVTANCTACEETWLQVFDFTLSACDFEVQDYPSSEPAGEWQSGLGFVGKYRGIQGSNGAYYVYVRSPVVDDHDVIDAYMTVHFDDDEEYFRVVSLRSRKDNVDQSAFAYEAVYTPPGPTPESGEYGSYSPRECDQYQLYATNIHQGKPQPSQGATCDFRISKLVVRGTGDNPWTI